MILQPLADVPTQRVDGRVVDDDDGDFAVLFHRDGNRGFFGHFKLLGLNSVRIERSRDAHRQYVPSGCLDFARHERSEEHTSELQSLMRISYAVFCLKKKTTNN